MSTQKVAVKLQDRDGVTQTVHINSKSLQEYLDKVQDGITESIEEEKRDYYSAQDFLDSKIFESWKVNLDGIYKIFGELIVDLQSKKLPQENFLVRENSIENTKDFGNLVQWEYIKETDSFWEGLDVLIDSNAVKKEDIIDRVDGMILIAKIENGDKKIGTKIEANKKGIPEGYFQFIRVGENKEPILFRNLKTGDFSDTTYSKAEALEYIKLEGGKFLLFENYLICKDSMTVIKQFNNKLTEDDFLSLGNNNFKFGNGIFDKIDGIYTKIGEIDGDGDEDKNIKKSGNKKLIVGKATSEGGYNNPHIEFLNCIILEVKDFVFLSNSEGKHECRNIKTNEIIWSENSRETFTSFENDTGNITVLRHGRTIKIIAGTGEEIELNNGLHDIMGLRERFGKKKFPMYNDTTDFVQHGLEVVITKMGYWDIDNFKERLINKDDSTAKFQLIQFIKEIRFGKNKDESTKFYDKYLDFALIIEALEKIKIIHKLLNEEYTNGVVEFSYDTKTDVEEYYVSKPNCYKILGKSVFNRFLPAGKSVNKKYLRDTIGDYNIIENIRTGEIMLVKNLDGKVGEREFIYLYKDFPIKEYIDIDSILKHLNEKRQLDRGKKINDQKIQNLKLENNIPQNAVAVSGCKLDGFFSSDKEIFYSVGDDAVTEIDVHSLINERYIYGYSFSIGTDYYEIMGSKIRSID